MRLSAEMRRALLWLDEARQRSHGSHGHVSSQETWRDMADVGVNYRTAAALYQRRLVHWDITGDMIELRLTIEGIRQASKIDKVPARLS